MMKPHERIFVALDTPQADVARELARDLNGVVGGSRIGLEIFLSHGPALGEKIRHSETNIFPDLKLHDIPNPFSGDG